MPGPNHVMLASGAAVAVSVAVATAIALYESPELRRYADDVRRRIALAMHSLGDGINPPHRAPFFNRPEDADGFMMSSRGDGANPGVDADEETRRRQREELLYWNSVRVAKEEEDARRNSDTGESAPKAKRGSSFDDFLRKDESGGDGTYVFKSGAETHGDADGLRRRGDNSHAFSSVYANPFADENGISNDDLGNSGDGFIRPGKDETASDIYSVTTSPEAAEPAPSVPETSTAVETPEDLARSSITASSATLDRELADDEYMTAGQDDRREAYESIQAWAQNSHPDVFSPLPQTPEAQTPEEGSDIESLSDGQLTPTDSMSIVDANEAANDTQSRAGSDGRRWDVDSVSDGMTTPASWSEVGSQISDSDHQYEHAPAW
ncbi:hypothetical protein N3K66_000487 [Trichothecium roseum]|uniref:Uncharacterized protein n=1 Tax=Trichothecium roseum TaxID=47278 RepID=A0ACC0VCW1_9HYPO|nr:hypothetical protein N3K66_000487 [Trichothecium roseum]